MWFYTWGQHENVPALEVVWTASPGDVFACPCEFMELLFNRKEAKAINTLTFKHFLRLKYCWSKLFSNCRRCDFWSEMFLGKYLMTIIWSLYLLLVSDLFSKWHLMTPASWSPPGSLVGRIVRFEGEIGSLKQVLLNESQK